jgi:polysaccharide transporter, PST family
VINYFEDNRICKGHGTRSLRGGAISMSARASIAIFQIGSMLFLARLLSPEDYGLVSMVIAITGFAPLLVDLGTRDAVVQRARITQAEVGALFWITVAIGCGCTLLVAACGPLIARFYRDPRLAMIVLVSSFTFIATALTCQHYALMRRAMMFKELAIIDVGANLLSAGGAIIMAYYGFGYWALIIKPITSNLLLALGLWSVCRWLPTRPAITSGVKEMLKFGMHLIGFSMTDFAGRNSDRVAIGHRIGARGLGYYQNALALYDNVLDLAAPLHGVAVVSLSKLQNDHKELRRSWAKAISTLAFFAMPVFGIMAVTSHDLIIMVLGRKWASSGVLLSVLALRGIPHVIERTLGWLHVAAGRTDRWMRWGIIGVCVQLAALFCGLPFGPMGVVIAYVLCMYILFVPAIAYAGHPLGIGVKDVLKAVGPQLTGALISAIIGFLLRYTLLVHTQGLARIALLALTYLVAYYALVVRIFGLNMPLHVSYSLVRGFLPAWFNKFSVSHAGKGI